ncbi:MAG: 1,4-dihydroxy-6-naphthoate synthase, partial [Saprospiraceae bacterium]|nr:1,4-dihydroxy-6-naphthoate synthase [Saprospiraceae bacterium]
MKLTIGISPCPNDTFIFDAIYNRRIDTRDLEFEFVMEDVEYLNRAAFEGRLDITKLSYYAFTQLTPMYQMMQSGGALGRNCGPLLVSNRSDFKPDENSRIAIPGKNTTANFLLSLAYPKLNHKEEVIFSSIEEQVASGAFDAGLIIHESRFTYRDKGLHLVTDLGVFWEQRTGTPIPLGGIVIKRSLDEQVKQAVNQVIRESVQFAFDHPKVSHE